MVLSFFNFLKQTKMDYQEVLGLSLDISTAKKKRERTFLSDDLHSIKYCVVKQSVIDIIAV